MRKIVAIATALATMMSAVVPGYAQSVAARSGPAKAEVNPVLVATFKAFPNGGQALTDRIRTLILQNNDVAPGLARYLRSTAVLSAGQRDAAEKALAEALSRLGIFAQAAPPSTGFNSEWLAVIAGLAAVGGLGAYVASRNQNSSVSPN
jgi:hypothetical protein